VPIGCRTHSCHPLCDDDDSRGVFAMTDRPVAQLYGDRRMNVVLRGVRGSLPSPRPETARYGGNTSCVEVRAEPGCLCVLDAGTGIRAVDGKTGDLARVDVLLTHLHMDHILGLGFFRPLYQPGLEVHIWGPASSTQPLHDRLTRYLSPPLFPVRLRDLPCKLELHDAPRGPFEVPGLSVTADLVCHPGPTLGYRLEDLRGGVLTYISDHEPALGNGAVDGPEGWTSGYDLAKGADVLIHDAQYTDEEYPRHIGWGHSALSHALSFAAMTGVGCLIPFHHDPDHEDQVLDAIYANAGRDWNFDIAPAQERTEFTVG
jgi:phosphoribosyl 1,2-cyclic phosphodiesterase